MRMWRWLALLTLLPMTWACADEALIKAAEQGNTAEVKRLLGGGARINGRDARGRNAVLAATQGGHTEAARLLISLGADINAQDDQRDSAFLLAGARGHTKSCAPRWRLAPTSG